MTEKLMPRSTVRVQRSHDLAAVVPMLKERLDQLPVMTDEQLEAVMREKLIGTSKPAGSTFYVYAPAPDHGEPEWRIFEEEEDFRTAKGRRFKSKLAMQNEVWNLRKGGHEVRPIGFAKEELEPRA